MKKKLLKILIWFSSLLILLLTTFFLILYFNKDKIQNLLVNEINESLRVPVSVSKVDISLKKFPSASLVFTDIYTRGINSAPNDTLLYAEQVFFQFDIWQALTSTISVKEISIENAVLNLKISENKNTNYKIWNEDESSDNEIFTLEEINLITSHIRFFDQSNNVNVSLSTPKSTVKGEFKPNLTILKTDANLEINHLIINNISSAKKFSSQLKFTFTQTGEISEFSKSTIKVAGIPFNFNAHLEENNSHFSAENQKIDLAKLQRFLEDQKLYVNENLETQGSAQISIEWNDNSISRSALKILFNTQDAEIQNNSSLKLKDISCKGYYTLNNKSDLLSIESFAAKGKTGSINGSLLLKNASKPFVKLKLNSNINLQEWASITSIDTLEKAKGKLDLKLEFENQFSSLTNFATKDFKNAKTKGFLKIDDGNLRFKKSNYEMESLNGELRFSNNNAIVDRLFFKTGKSDIFLDGIFKNVLNFIVLDNQKLVIDCRVKSQNIKIEDFIQANDQEDPDSYNLRFTDAIDLELILEIGKFSMKHFAASDVKGNLAIKDKKIIVKNLRMNSDEGSYTGNLTVNLANPKIYTLNSNLNFSNININQLFKSFDNFGQEAILAKNIYGNLNGKTQLKANMSPDLEIDLASIKLTSSIEIKNGHIKDYAPMLELSRFSDIEELKDVYFRSLKNNITINNSTITIPEMLIKSNVLDLHVNGTHSFDNILDYRLKLKAEDALFKKRKKNSKPSEFDEHLVQRSKDEPYLYIKMYGAIDALKIELDKKSIGKSIKDDLKNQGQQIKEIFKRDKPDKKSDNPGIIYEWDEEDDG